MKLCKYMHNLFNIKYAQKFTQKDIYIGKNIHNYNKKYWLLDMEPTYYYYIYIIMKVNLKNIKYPYLELANTENSISIWEGKTESIDILKKINLMFR